jgi:hypothetical protein
MGNIGTIPEGLKYVLDRDVGGNLLTIMFMHSKQTARFG